MSKKKSVRSNATKSATPKRKGTAQKLKPAKSKSAKPKASEAKRKSAKAAPRPAPVGEMRSFDDLPEGTTLQLVGLIAPGGGGGGSSDGRGKTWTFSTEVAAWKAKGGPLVQEPALLVFRGITERKLTTLMKSANSLDVVAFTGHRPDRKQRAKTYARPQRFELSKLGPRTRDRDLEAIRKELLKPVVHRDKTFGTLRLNRDQGQFEGKAEFRKTEMNVTFHVESIDELKELIELTKPLWKQRAAWFATWRNRVRDYYMQVLARNWWAEDYELTPAVFDRALGWPVHAGFSIEDGEFRYTLGGWSEDLVTDHGIDAYGSTIDDMTVEF